MTREGSIDRLGIDLGTIEAKPPPLTSAPPAPNCPGAALRVSSDYLAEMRRGGETFRPPREPIPRDGLGDIRVSCTQPVAQLPKTASGNTQYYGLCHSCSGLEVGNRQWLRARSGER